MHTYMHTYMHAYIHACMHTYKHTHIHTCMHTYMHTHIHTNKQTYIHTFSWQQTAPPFGRFATNQCWTCNQSSTRDIMRHLRRVRMWSGLCLRWAHIATNQWFVDAQSIIHTRSYSVRRLRRVRMCEAVCVEDWWTIHSSASAETCLAPVAVCCSLLQSVAVVSFQRITEQLLLSMSEFVINVWLCVPAIWLCVPAI